MRVIKQSGEREDYDERKVMSALLRSGASPEEANLIILRLQPKIYDGIPTREIYRLVRQMLDRKRRVRYSLKDAIFSLGPEGYYFEDLISRLFEELGYSVRVRECAKGRCVSHEVDILVEKEGVKHMVECKFHNRAGTRCGIQTALYTYARFLDLRETSAASTPWLVTNTKFSNDVIKYAECVGLNLIGWGFPQAKGLECLLENYKLYPLTTLQIRKDIKNALLSKGIITLKDAVMERDLLLELLPEYKVNEIIEASEEILGGF